MLVERAGFASNFGVSFRGTNGVAKRDLKSALGYHTEILPKDYRDRYERGGRFKPCGGEARAQCDECCDMRNLLRMQISVEA